MSDYDKYGNAPYELPESGRAPYVLLGLLGMIALIGGLMYFNGTPRDSSNTANAPSTTSPANAGERTQPKRVPAATPMAPTGPTVPKE